MIRGKGVVAGIIFPIVLILTAYALLTSHKSTSGTVVQAQFADAGLLAPGDYVEIDGATVGSVKTLTLTNHGTALATLNIDRGIPVRADASASVQDSDLLGDVYLSLDTGSAGGALNGPIPTARTFVATGLQDLFNSFDQPTRTALQTLIVELGTALDARGADLNQAVLQLSPTVSQLQRVASQVSAQNASLDRLIVNAHGLTSQLAPRTQDISRLITGLNNTLNITATRTPALNQGLKQLPQTLSDARSTLTKLTGAANAATPVAAQLEGAAPMLTDAVKQITPFVNEVKPALNQLSPVLTLAGQALNSSTLPLSLLQTTVKTLHTAAPPVVSLMHILDPVVAQGIIGVADGLGSLAAEPGPDGRNYFRGELALGCEMFGIPTHPGCLTEALQEEAGLTDSSGTLALKKSKQPAKPAATATPTAAPTKAVQSTVSTLTNALTTPLKQVQTTVNNVLNGVGGTVSGVTKGLSGTVQGVTKGLSGVTKGLGGLLGKGGASANATTGTQTGTTTSTSPSDPLSQLLKYLVGS